MALVSGPRRCVGSQCIRHGIDPRGIDLTLEHPILLEDPPELLGPGVETDGLGAHLVCEESLDGALHAGLNGGRGARDRHVSQARRGQDHFLCGPRNGRIGRGKRDAK